MKKTTKAMLLFLCMAMFNFANAQNVTSGADDGSDGTLRKEIQDSPAGSTITFGPTVLTVTLNSEILINKSLTIQGSAILNTIIDADDNGRVFHVTSGTLTLNNLNLINGLEDDGGAIYITNATANINDCAINNNVADGASGSGGGIYVDVGGKIVVTDTEISNNQANRAGGGIEDNSGTGIGVELLNVVMNNNNAGVAPAIAAPGNGGAIHITGAGSIDITACVFNQNIAASEGGALWNGSGVMTIDDSMIDDNTASGDASDQGGGGIYNLSGMLTILNGTEITNNTADGTAGSGGGILNDVGATLSVSDTEISGNSSNRAGGGIEDNSGAGSTVTLTNVDLLNNTTGSMPGNGGGLHISGDGSAMIMGGSVNGNSATLEGGGLWNNTGTMTVNGTTINNNTASGDAADEGGGGLFNNGGTLIVMNATITGNVADGTAGSGGGILNNLGVLTVEDTTISGNSSNRAGGGIEDNSMAGNLLTLENVDFTLNTTGANPGNGGGLHITGPGNSMITGGSATDNTASREGGGLWNGSGNMIIDGMMISDNMATGNEAHDGGGGIFNNGGNLSIVNNTVISGNLATGTSGSGGGILSTTGAVNISNSELSANSANRAGGAIEFIDGTSLVDNVLFSANDVNGTAGTAAPGNGGAIHITGVTSIAITNSDFLNNDAANEGGALWNQVNSNMSVATTTIDNNAAFGNGGGGIFNNGGMLSLTTSTVSNNTATTAVGGGIYNDTGMMEILRSTIAMNTATTDGGGIYNSDALMINAATIGMNAATNNGGGIFGETSVALKNTIVANNTASAGQDVMGMLTSNGYNFIGDDDQSDFPNTEPSDILGGNPMLGTLSDNGGETQTIPLMAGSSAIDAGDPGDTFNDQRNYVISGTRDMGAFEFGGMVNTENVTVDFLTSVYPNPSNGVVTIDINRNVVGEINLSVYNISGSLIGERKLETGQNQLDLTQYASGVYLLRVQNSNDVNTLKLVIQ